MKYYVVMKTYTLDWKIDEIEVERATDKSVWIDGRRRNRFSEYANYFPTFQEAKNHAVKVAKGKVDDRTRLLDRAKKELAQALQLKEQG